MRRHADAAEELRVEEIMALLEAERFDSCPASAAHPGTPPYRKKKLYRRIYGDAYRRIYGDFYQRMAVMALLEAERSPPCPASAAHPGTPVAAFPVCLLIYIHMYMYRYIYIILIYINVYIYR